MRVLSVFITLSYACAFRFSFSQQKSKLISNFQSISNLLPKHEIDITKESLTSLSAASSSSSLSASTASIPAPAATEKSLAETLKIGGFFALW